MRKMSVLVALLILGGLLVGSLGAADQLKADKTTETFLGERERYEVRKRKAANPEGKNLVSNGSFELGTCNWELSLGRSIWIPWMLDLAGKEEMRWQIDKSTCHDGEASLLVQGMTDDQSSIGLLAFSPLFLSNQKSYALSFYAKGNGLAIRVGDKSFPTTQDWQRHSVVIKGEPAYYLRFVLTGTGKLWLDAVQIEEGSEVTAFSPTPTVELGLLTDRDDGIYYSGTRPTVYFHLYNGSRRTARGKVVFEVKNFYHDVVAKGNLPFVLGPGKKQELTRQLDLKDKGIFWTRAVLLEEGARKKDSELNFAILSPLDGKDTFFGASQWESGNAQKQFKIARDMGMSFFLPYGPFNYIVPKDWKTGIAKLGKEDVPYALRLARQYGLSLIGETGGVPAWASPEGRIGQYKDFGEWGLPAPNNITREVLSGWSDFIFTTVDRFKNSISYWEIWHEGNAESKEDADAMVRFLKAASQAAKRANPDCTIIGHGFCHYDFVKQAELCFEQGGLPGISHITLHILA